MKLRHHLAALKPSFWLQNHRQSRVYDAYLNQLMDNNAPVERISWAHAKVGNIKVWTSNFPYCYGTCEDLVGGVMARRCTISRLHEYITARCLENAK